MENLTLSSWWMSVIVVGIIINMLSGYLTRLLNTIFSKISKWGLNRSELRKKEHDVKVRTLKENHKQFINAFLEETNYRTIAIYWLQCFPLV